MTEAVRDWAAIGPRVQAAHGRGELPEVVRLLSGAEAAPDAPLWAIRLLATTLRGLRRNREAAVVLKRLTELQPSSAVAEHNLAAALGDMGDASGAEAAARRAFSKGGDAPETWLVLARALTNLSRIEEAEQALTQALARRPLYGDALKDLAQLIWMKTGDPDQARGPLDRALMNPESDEGLLVLRAAVLFDMLGAHDAYAALKPGLTSPRADLALAAASIAAEIDPDLALEHALMAARAAPSDPKTQTALASALIAAGRPGEALGTLERHLATAPHDQHALALQTVAWRVLGDDRALSTADYERLTRAYRLEVTQSQLDRAAEGLQRLHPFVAQPFGQSVRSGIQSALDPRYAGDRSIDAVFRALDAPITDYVSAMAGHDDAMSHRAGSGHEIIGAWSVRLTAGGRHSDHIHPEGWVSSALYITTPQVDPTDPRAGWLRFGAVRLGVGLELPAEHWIEPRPGVVALFPSWMWHGTEPFRSQGVRMTIAFDVQPR